MSLKVKTTSSEDTSGLTKFNQGQFRNPEYIGAARPLLNIKKNFWSELYFVEGPWKVLTKSSKNNEGTKSAELSKLDGRLKAQSLL